MAGNSAYPYPNRLGLLADDALSAGTNPGGSDRRWRRWQSRGAGLFSEFDLRSPIVLGAPTSMAGPGRAMEESAREIYRHFR